jgi:uncharacterized membrane protein YgcG
MVYGEVPGVSPLQPLPDAYLLWPQLSLARAVYLINFQCGTMARCPRWGDGDGDGDGDGAGLPGDGGSSPSAELHGCIRALYLAALGYALLAVAIDTYGTADLGQVRTECQRLTSQLMLRARLCLCMACGRSRSKQRSSGCYVGTMDDGNEEMPLPSSHLAANDSKQPGAVIDAGASAAVRARARASAQSSTFPLVIHRLCKSYPPASSTAIDPLRTLWQRVTSDCTRGGSSDTTACPLPTRDLATNTAAPSVSATGGQQVVKDFSLAVRSGECFALLGKNGAGKTSLIKCLTGHHPPDSSSGSGGGSGSGSGSGSGGTSGGSAGGGGDAWIGGHSIRTSLRRAQLKLGVCPQYR